MSKKEIKKETGSCDNWRLLSCHSALGCHSSLEKLLIVFNTKLNNFQFRSGVEHNYLSNCSQLQAI